MLNCSIHDLELHFKHPAGTSRGIYTTRKVYYIHIFDDQTRKHGFGECAPLPNLSCDDIPNYLLKLYEVCKIVETTGEIPYDALRDYPSVLFGFETAFCHLRSTRDWAFFPTPFSQGKQPIPINGLIWMGRYEEMKRRIDEKLDAGFRCIKIKIGAIEFEREMELLNRIRQRYSERDLELRVDANGAFTPEEAPGKLQQLGHLDLHSIEQPIRAGQWEAMQKLCRTTPVPIALDEELIGINHPIRKEELMSFIRPQYLVLKPSLHGGMKGTEEWIHLCHKYDAEAWFTSALESNIGLNAIAQWCATHTPFEHCQVQGLGTGGLYTNNVPFPFLLLEGDRLYFDAKRLDEELSAVNQN